MAVVIAALAADVFGFAYFGRNSDDAVTIKNVCVHPSMQKWITDCILLNSKQEFCRNQSFDG